MFGKASVKDANIDSSNKEDVMIGPEPPTESEYDEGDMAKAEEYKLQGNEFFKNNKYDEALDAYSEAIFLNVPPAKKAIYYCNRAQVSIRTENYALALFDA